MGVISILLGIISFFGFTGAGALLANAVIDQKVKFSATFTALANISNASILIGIIAFCAIIGLLVCMNLVMHGLTYRKVSQLHQMATRARKKNR